MADEIELLRLKAKAMLALKEKQRQTIPERFREGAVEAVATGTLARGYAEAPKNRADALERAITSAQEEGRSAGYYPFNRPVSELAKEYESLSKEATTRLDAYKMVREDINKNMARGTGNAAVDFVTDLASSIPVGITDPSNFVPIPGAGLGQTIARSAARALPGNALAGGLQNLVGQEQDIRLGIQNKPINYGDAAMSALVGGAAGGVLNAGVHAGSNILHGRPINGPAEPPSVGNQQPSGTPQEQAIIQKAQEYAASQNRPLRPEDIELAQRGSLDVGPVLKEQLDLPRESYTPEELLARNQEAAQGEVISARESLEGLRREETGTRDMFQGTGLKEEPLNDLQALKDKAIQRLQEERAIPYDPYSGKLPDTTPSEPISGGLEMPTRAGLDIYPRPEATNLPQIGLESPTALQERLKQAQNPLELARPDAPNLELVQNTPSDRIGSPRINEELNPSINPRTGQAKGFGGASEMSNMGSDLFRTPEDMSMASGSRPIPFDGGTAKADLEAAAKPGFMRTAEEVMAANRLMKAGQEAATAPIEGVRVDPADIRRQYVSDRITELENTKKRTKEQTAELKALRLEQGETGKLSSVPKNIPSARLQERILANDFRGGMEVVANLQWKDVKGTISKPMLALYQHMAKMFLKDPDFSPTLKVVPVFTEQMLKDAGALLEKGETPDTVRGMSHKGDIILASKWGADASIYTFMHEALHARISRYVNMFLNGVAPNGAYSSAITSHIRNLNSLYNYVKGIKTIENAELGKKDSYGLQDLHEFTAELANEDFLRELDAIPVKPTASNGLRGFVGSVLDAIVHVYSSIVNTNNKTAMHGLLSETAKLLKAIDKNNADLAQKQRRAMYTKEGAEWEGKLDANFKANLAKAPQEVKPPSREDFVNSLRISHPDISSPVILDALYKSHLEQFERDNGRIANPLGFDNSTIPELKQRLYRADGTRRVGDMTPAESQATAFHGANAHPLVNRVWSAITQASTASDNLFNRLYRRYEVGPKGLGYSAMHYARRNESPNSVAVLGNNLSIKEKADLFHILQEFQDTNPKLLFDDVFLAARGISGNVRKFLKELDKSNRELHTEVNKTLRSVGMEEIPYNEGWIASRQRFGDFHVMEIDSRTGNHTFLQGFSSRKEAEAVSRYVNDASKRNTVVIPANKNPKKSTMLSADAFLEALKLVDPKEKADFKVLIEEAMKRNGIKSHGLKRDSTAGGYVGSKEAVDALGTKDAFKQFMIAVEDWYRQGAGFVSSADARKVVSELVSDESIKADFPTATGYARHMWDNYTGIDRLGDALIKEWSLGWANSWLGKQFYTNSKSIDNAIAGGGRMFIASALTAMNPVFYLSSALQYMLAPARLTQAGKRAGFEGSVTLSSLKATRHMQMPTIESKALMTEFLESGIIEPRFAEALDWSMSSDNPVITKLKFLTGEKVAAYADSYGRGTAAFMAYEYARSAGLDHKTAMSFAERETSGIMGQYEKWARMPMLNKLGKIGDAISPLTTFVSNQAFQLASLIKDATIGFEDKGRLIKPLMLLLGANIVMGGIRGLPGYEDMEQLYLTLNSALAEHGYGTLPTPQEMFLSSLPKGFVGDAIEFGLPSAALGVNASSTFGMGTIVGNIGETAGLDYLSNIFKLASGLWGSHTEYEKFKERSTVTPALLKEVMRADLAGQSPLEPAAVLGRDNKPDYIRNQEEQYRALLTGKTPINEARAKNAKYTQTTLELAQKEARSKAAILLAEQYQKGGPMDPFVERVLQNQPEYAESIIEAAKKRLEDSNMDYRERELMKLKNNSKMQDIDLFLGTHSNVR